MGNDAFDMEQALMLALGASLKRLDDDKALLSASTTLNGWVSWGDSKFVQISVNAEICDRDLLEQIPMTGGVVESYRDMVDFLGYDDEAIILAMAEGAAEEREKCCAAMCRYCRLEVPIVKENGKWLHRSETEGGVVTTPCWAAAIRNQEADDE